MAASDRPLPQLIGEVLDEPFWEACNQRRFLLHRCGMCGRHYWPASCCVDHGAQAMSWVPASGSGTVHTFTVIHQRYHPAFAPELPYNVVVVELTEGPFFHSRVLGCGNEDLFVGMPVQVVFEEAAPGILLPYFRPSEEAIRLDVSA
jgi:uncharacterized OB-fold protein